MQNINRDILKLALPSILANITVPIVGMVDIAVAGHLDANAATLIGGIAIGTMLFDLLYWNFGALRVSTGGLTAQAFGRGDMKECARIFTRSVGVALMCAMVLLAIQWVFVKAAFLVVDCTPEVQALATQYFFVRIWAAPATLSLMSFKGWFIGMQDSVSPMVTDLVVNGMNILMSFVLALGIPGILNPMGFKGIAMGTVVAQWSGLTVACILLWVRYRKRAFAGFVPEDATEAFRGGEIRHFFVMNTELFVRSLCFIAIYIGFTTISARYGDLLLAVSSIMMKILMIFSYFTDGFAYAGEALTGRYIGAKDKPMVRQTVKWTFIWSMGIALIFMAVYHFGGVSLVRMMTSDSAVVEQSAEYLPWLLLMPVVGCAAFTWDGIYIGATASKTIRNAMLWAVVAFVAVWAAGMLVLQHVPGLDASTLIDGGQMPADIVSMPPAEESGPAATRYGILAMHVLMAAYFAHLLARTLHLTIRYRKVVLGF